MSLLVDTSVWSQALRRDAPSGSLEVQELQRALRARDIVATTGLVLQELLQGFSGPKARDRIIQEFAVLPLVVPNRFDHIDAAELRNRCRRAGIQVGTIDALLAQLCVRHDLTLLTSDNDFGAIAERSALRIWRAPR